MDIYNYLNVFKMAGISPDIGEKICQQLSESILDRLTKVGMDRRIIKPILEIASKRCNGVCDENIDSILKDANLITSLMVKYCK